jgi:hypothetical protein
VRFISGLQNRKMYCGFHLRNLRLNPMTSFWKERCNCRLNLTRNSWKECNCHSILKNYAKACCFRSIAKAQANCCAEEKSMCSTVKVEQNKYSSAKAVNSGYNVEPSIFHSNATV